MERCDNERTPRASKAYRAWSIGVGSLVLSSSMLLASCGEEVVNERTVLETVPVEEETVLEQTREVDVEREPIDEGVQD